MKQGRKPGDRHCVLYVRISREAADILSDIPNKSEFIDRIIIESKRQ